MKPCPVVCIVAKPISKKCFEALSKHSIKIAARNSVEKDFHSCFALSACSINVSEANEGY